jgi:hypothetical protein
MATPSPDCHHGDCWLHRAPLGPFVNQSDSFAYTKRARGGGEAVRSPPPPPPPPKCLGSHTLQLDSAGKLLTWLPAKTAHHDLVMQAMGFLDRVPVEPRNGLPVYYTGPRLPVANYPHNPASLFAQWTDLALRFYAYTGNSSWITKAEAMLAHHLVNGTTPNSSDWAWPGVPYASSDPGDVFYRGASVYDNTSRSGAGDGAGVLETDKIGGLGLGWLAIWKHHGSGARRQDFLIAAVHCARVLATKVATGNRTASPWPFRAFAQSGAVRAPGGHIGERYSAM